MTSKAVFRKVILCISILLFSQNANAWFFFFIPGSLTSKIADSLSGSEGENCVGENAKVGDTIRSPAGNTATIKSLSGTSSRCQNPKLPVRALLAFNYSFASKAGINVPDGYEQKPLTDTQKFNGGLLSAVHPTTWAGMYVSARKREKNTDSAAIARSVGTAMSNAIENAKIANEEQLTIGTMKAWRFEVTGKNRGLFGRTYTYLITLLEGDEEFVVVNTYALEDDYANEKESLKQVVTSVTGLKAPASQVVSTPTPTSAPAIPSSALPTPAPVPATLSGAADGKAAAEADKALTTIGGENTGTSMLTSATASQTTTPATPSNTQANVLEKSSGQASAAQRLKNLNALYKEGLINEKDFEAKKQEILKGI